MVAGAGDTSCRSDQRDISVEAAAILLTLAMRETESPVAELGGALDRISCALGSRRDGVVALADTSAKAQAIAQADAVQAIESLRSLVSQDLAVCVRGLQFHDRLIQQLAAVRNLLASLADHVLPDVSGFGAQRWEELLLTLRERLTADSQHQVFDLLLRTGAFEFEGRSNSEKLEGSVELF
ncbi:MAG: hypothetical protein WDO56_09885 [Gammaproteobacteria bacterium]